MVSCASQPTQHQADAGRMNLCTRHTAPKQTQAEETALSAIWPPQTPHTVERGFKPHKLSCGQESGSQGAGKSAKSS